jgi:hypothetical protein
MLKQGQHDVSRVPANRLLDADPLRRSSSDSAGQKKAASRAA